MAPGVAGLSLRAEQLLIGVSVYREPADSNAVVFQLGEHDWSAARAPDRRGPAPPYQPPPDMQDLLAACTASGMLHAATRGKTGAADSWQVDAWVAGEMQHHLTAAGRQAVLVAAHRRAAEYWQWRATAWPQDRRSDLHDLLEARHHLFRAGDAEQASEVTQAVCAQLHAWGDLGREAELIQSTLEMLPARSVSRATWMHELGTIYQVRCEYGEAYRCYSGAVQMFAILGDFNGVSRGQHSLGVLAQAQGDYRRAERHYKRSSAAERRRDGNGLDPDGGMTEPAGLTEAAVYKPATPLLTPVAPPSEAEVEQWPGHLVGATQTVSESGSDGAPPPVLMTPVGLAGHAALAAPAALAGHAALAGPAAPAGPARAPAAAVQPPAQVESPPAAVAAHQASAAAAPAPPAHTTASPAPAAAAPAPPPHTTASPAPAPAPARAPRTPQRVPAATPQPAASAPQRSDTHDGTPRRTRRMLGRRSVFLPTVIAAGLACLFAAGLSAALARTADPSADTRSGGAARPISASAARAEAAAWVAAQVSRSAVIACDAAECAALHQRGLPVGDLLTLGPGGPADPLASDVIVVTAAVRAEFGARLAAVYAPVVLARFGTGPAAIQVRIIAADGTAAYLRAAHADLVVQRRFGTELARNSHVIVAGPARPALIAGRVDSRLLATLATLADIESVRIIAFGDAGPHASAGVPLRSVEIAAPAGAAASWKRTALRFLADQRDPFLPSLTALARPAGAGRVLLIEYPSPSPLGLLEASGATPGA